MLIQALKVVMIVILKNHICRFNKRLLKQKLIQRYTIDVNDKELGYSVKSVTGINMDSKRRDAIIDNLFEIDGVREISEVTGRFDIMVTMYAKTLSDMHRVVSEKIGKIEGILGSESWVFSARSILAVRSG